MEKGKDVFFKEMDHDILYADQDGWVFTSIFSFLKKGKRARENGRDHFCKPFLQVKNYVYFFPPPFFFPFLSSSPL